MLAKRNEFMEGIYQRSTEKRRRMAEQRLSLSLVCSRFLDRELVVVTLLLPSLLTVVFLTI